MTLSATTARVSYTGDGATSSYDYTFKIFSKNDLRVVRVDSDSAETELIVDLDYTVSGVGDEDGGSIALSAGNLTSGYKLIILRGMDAEQNTALRNQSPFYPEVIEDGLDAQAMINQQHEEMLSRALRVPASLGSTVDSELPVGSVIDLQNRAITFNSTATGFEAGPTASDIAGAASAAASAIAAAAGIDNIFKNLVGYGGVSNATYVLEESSANDNALAAAIAALPSGGGSVYIPAGTYWFASPAQIPESVHIFGDGIGNTVLRTHTDLAGNFSSTDNSRGILNFVGESFVATENLIVDLKEGDTDLFFADDHGASVGDLICIVDTSHQVIVDITASFSVAEVITGGASGTQGSVLRTETTDDGKYQRLWCNLTTGASFTVGEAVTGSGSGSGEVESSGGSFSSLLQESDDGEFFKVTSVPNSKSVEIAGGVMSTYGFYKVSCSLYRKPCNANETGGGVSQMTILGTNYTKVGGGFIHGTDTPNADAYPYCVDFLDCSDVFVSKVEAKDAHGAAISLSRSYNITVDKTKAECNGTIASNTGLNYGLAIISSSAVRVTNSSLIGIRHGVASGSSAFAANKPNPKNMDLSYESCTIASSGGSTATGEHSGVQFYRYSNCKTLGGVLLTGSRGHISGCEVHTQPYGTVGSAIYAKDFVDCHHTVINNVVVGNHNYSTESFGLFQLQTAGSAGEIATARKGKTVVKNNIVTLAGSNQKVLGVVSSDPGGATDTVTFISSTAPARVQVAEDEIYFLSSVDGSDVAGPYTVSSISSPDITFTGNISALVEPGYIAVSRHQYRGVVFLVNDTTGVEGDGRWDLEISGNSVYQDANSKFCAKYGGTAFPVRNLHICDNKIYGGSGIDTNAISSTNVHVENNYHNVLGHDISWEGIQAWFISWSGYGVVKNNTIVDPYYGAIHIYPSANATAPQSEVSGNKIYGCNSGNAWGTASVNTGITVQYASYASTNPKVHFHSNTFFDSTSANVHSVFYFDNCDVIYEGNNRCLDDTLRDGDDVIFKGASANIEYRQCNKYDADAILTTTASDGSFPADPNNTNTALDIGGGTGAMVMLRNPARVTVLADGSVTGSTVFRVTGVDVNGTSISEDFTDPTTTRQIGTKIFSAVYSISRPAGAGNAGVNITVGVMGTEGG